MQITDLNGFVTYSDVLFQKTSNTFQIIGRRIELKEAQEILIFDLNGRLLHKETTTSLDLNRLEHVGLKLVKIQDMTFKTL